MDGGLGNEVAPGDVVEDVHFRGKESEFSLSLRQPESSNLVERSDEAAVHGEGDYLDSSFDVISGILEGRTASGNISAGDGSATRFVGDAGNMVEELMVKKNYDGSNVAIVGMSNHREKLESRWTQWQPRFQVGVGSGSGSSRSNVWHRDDGQTASPCENNNTQNVSSSEFMGQGTSNDLSTEAVGQLVDTEHVESADMVSRGGFRTKMLSKSGFADFFIKNTLKGKGAVFRGHHHNVARHEPVVQENGRTPIVMTTSCSASTSLGENHVIPSVSGVTRPRYGGVDHDGVSLREWLNVGRHGVDKVECFHIFRRIVDLVDSFHSKGVVLSELRPSCFKLLPSKQVRYLGSADKRDDLGNALDQDVPCLGIPTSKKRIIDQGLFSSPGLHMKKQKLSESVNPGNRWPQFSVKYGSSKLKTGEDDFAFRQQVLNDSTGGNSNVGHGAQSNLSFPRLSNVVQQQLLTCAKDPVEEKWYASPEELSEGIHTMSSNIYALGVLLFELLSHFDSEGARATAMSDLCNRILPPHFLSENLKEAGFCLLLLHPEPSSRPTTREILQSDVINGLPDVSVEELSSSIEKDDAESELLSYFLVSLKAHKQSNASKLMNDIKCLEADIKEVEKRNYSKKSPTRAYEHSFQQNDATAEGVSPVLSNPNTKEMRLMRNISQLESAYFSMRGKVQVPEANPSARQDKYLLRNREIWQTEEEAERNYNSADCLGEFFDGLCKYARYSKFQVRGSLRTGEFNNSANVICSLSFDRDKDYFAAAGVSKKIKIYDFGSLFNDSVDIHYPAVEMTNKSKLSCICWNNYIKNYLASTDYDGVVKLWDASTGQGVSQYNEHQRRAWSVDFSPVYPTKLATGSDDCTVKLWSINEKNSLATIKNIANVCCVQFSSHSTHLLAFGSADFRTYCYDIRHVRMPWCILSGHEKAVSYVKFVDADTIVTASTDNSLKLWDLKKTNGSGLSMDACSSTLRGHTNEKNFVGLSVADGYISCGSETNEVYAYHRSLPMPMASHKFGSEDPISGKETDDDNGQFVSSVCWKGNSDTLLAANSSGCIKVLQMV
ncbi:Protein SPA1-RELATED 2 [Linum perenne]